MTTPAVDAAVQALLDAHDFLELVTTGEEDGQRVRVRCGLTQHEMVPRADAINTYLSSKKFVKARDWYCFDYSKYEPYIVAHRRKPKSLYCNVTGTVLNRIPAEVEKHVNGKKFKRMKEHVTISTSKREGEGAQAGDDEFDANAFEFENSQVLYSDDEDEDAPKGKRGDDKDEEEDMDDEEEQEEEGGDDMDDLYPDEGDASEDERVHEEVQKALKAKAGADDAMDGEKPAKEAKKQPKKQPGKRTNHAKVVKKLRQQTKRMRVSSE